MTIENPPLVSIGMPFYNAEKHLKEALISILNQTFKDWELVLLDDGSTDSSCEIATDYTHDERIKIIRSNKNKSMTYRMNQWINLAKAKYMARMDADDIMTSERLATQVKIMEENPAIDVLGSNVYAIDGKNKITGSRWPIENKLKTVDTFVHPSIIAKREWYQKNRYDLRIKHAQDVFLWEKAKPNSVFCALMQPLLFYREEAGNYAKKYKIVHRDWQTLYKNQQDVKQKKKWKKRMTEAQIKYQIYRLAQTFKAEKYLLQHRNIKLSQKQLNEANNLLETSLKSMANHND